MVPRHGGTQAWWYPGRYPAKLHGIQADTQTKCMVPRQEKDPIKEYQTTKRGSSSNKVPLLRRLRNLAPRKEGNYKSTPIYDNSAARTAEGIDLSKVVDYRKQHREALFRMDYAVKCNIYERDFETHWANIERNLRNELDYLNRKSARQEAAVQALTAISDEELARYERFQERLDNLQRQALISSNSDPRIESEIVTLSKYMTKTKQLIKQFSHKAVEALTINQNIIARYRLVEKALEGRQGWFYTEHGQCMF
ncbi:uncharacterized protein LOC142341232 [Convolutriloba macropyga]|uniref:uncharacterized protein LOC142341232 n=1 Tax=Convolutriloba macropyga TaxID=536237 RepID=UPI003F51E880